MTMFWVLIVATVAVAVVDWWAVATEQRRAELVRGRIQGAV